MSEEKELRIVKCENCDKINFLIQEEILDDEIKSIALICKSCGDTSIGYDIK